MLLVLHRKVKKGLVPILRRLRREEVLNVPRPGLQLWEHLVRFVSLIDRMINDCGSEDERLMKELAESKERLHRRLAPRAAAAPASQPSAAPHPDFQDIPELPITDRGDFQRILVDALQRILVDALQHILRGMSDVSGVVISTTTCPDSSSIQTHSSCETRPPDLTDVLHPEPQPLQPLNHRLLLIPTSRTSLSCPSRTVVTSSAS
ncbi:hypothetical protein DY000_02060959 [Brassica cretica]|uniref:Dynamin stalk domain-containing protein n=1 Tax=Brassica cretica TaxID=69181 RepID=A0ABQ7AZ37_BRACR|nr:hypothetical protein DY000_02060959 [Brassica cretica]